jgi:hypothetical protein
LFLISKDNWTSSSKLYARVSMLVLLSSIAIVEVGLYGDVSNYILLKSWHVIVQGCTNYTLNMNLKLSEFYTVVFLVLDLSTAESNLFSHFWYLYTLQEPDFRRKLRQDPCLYSNQTYGSNSAHCLRPHCKRVWWLWEAGDCPRHTSGIVCLSFIACDKKGCLSRSWRTQV